MPFDARLGAARNAVDAATSAVTSRSRPPMGAGTLSRQPHVAPCQAAPDQLEPLHDEPDQLLALQLEALHELALHEFALHEFALQLEAAQLDPDQLDAFQVPPDQLDADASSAAVADESKGLPKMSCSPVSMVPSGATRWSEPRACSSEPVPLSSRYTEPTHGSDI